MNKSFDEYINDQMESVVIPALEDFIRLDNQSRSYVKDTKQNLEMQKKAIAKAKEFADSMKLENYKFHNFQEDERTPVAMAIFEASENYKDKTKGPIMMYGHLDKQPPLTEKWSEGLSPYNPVIKDKKLYGRGGVDDGYAFFCCILLMKAYQEFKIPYSKTILYFETDEESGSADLDYYLKKHLDLVGTPRLVVCLDSGTYDYKHFCLTSALRGVINFELSLDFTDVSYDSALFNNIVKDNYLILRDALRKMYEDYNKGVLLDKFQVKIPKENMDQCKQFVKSLGGKVDFALPLLEGVEVMGDDALEQVLNNVWRSTLTVLGQDKIPVLDKARNIIRKSTVLKISMRLPPTKVPEEMISEVKKFFSETSFKNDAKLKVGNFLQGEGFVCPFRKELTDLANKSAQKIFGEDLLFLGVGLSIPFMNVLQRMYPKSDFVISGMIGPHANIHAPDENYYIPYSKQLFRCLGDLISNYNKLY